MKKKRSKNGSKENTHSYKSVVEEPEAVYLTAREAQLLRVVHGNAENSYIKRALHLMGLEKISPFREVQNVSDFISCIREGVPKIAVDNLASITGFNGAEMAGILRTSDRNLRRYQPKEKLNAEQSERIIELAKLYSRGEEIFGSLDAFKEWMSSSVLALGNKKPKDFLDTSLGIEMLMDELGRIEHGIFA